MMNKIIPISGLIALRPFPTESRMRWRRMDVPGREEARVKRTPSGWRLTGELDVEEAGLAARLHYAIECDPEWHTRFAVIEGEAGGSSIQFALAADGVGNWLHDGAPAPDLGGALDVDLGFTPAINTLPVRRLALAVGERAPVRSAWLRFPELRLEPLDTDAFGRVVRYEGLWEAELAEPDGEQTEQSPTI